MITLWVTGLEHSGQSLAETLPCPANPCSLSSRTQSQAFPSLCGAGTARDGVLAHGRGAAPKSHPGSHPLQPLCALLSPSGVAETLGHDNHVRDGTGSPKGHVEEGVFFQSNQGTTLDWLYFVHEILLESGNIHS